MKKVKNLRNILLVAVVFTVLAVKMVVQSFYPTVNFPALNIPNLVALSLLTLLLEAWLKPNGENCWICNGTLAALTFALLPLAAGVTDVSDFWKPGLVGGVVFLLTSLAMDSVRDRISSGPPAKGALLATALGVYLASQCFTGILL